MRSLVYDNGSTRLVALHRVGRGRPILLLPGAMSDAAEWRSVAERLVPGRPVVVVNRRGRAPSGPLGPEYSVQTELDDLRALMSRLDEKVDLVGWSYGGLIALETAVRHPEEVHSVTAYEPIARPFAQDAVPALQAAVAAGDLDRAVELVNLRVSLYSIEHVAQLRGTRAWPALRALVAPAAAELAAVNDHHVDWKRYSTLSLPVALVEGALNHGRQPYGPALDMFVRALPQARVTTLPGQGHLAHVHAPNELAEHLNAALSLDSPHAR